MALTNTILSVQEIVNRYLYDTPTTPINKVDEDLIRKADTKGADVTVDVNAYMAEVGRFALGSMSDLTKKFFSWVGDIPGMVVGKEYTKSEAAALLGLNQNGIFSNAYYGINFQQYSYDDGRNDYSE